MKKCIYCLELKEGSDAHIISEALGGSLSIKDVCAPCNNQQGDSFEGNAVNSIIFSLARYVVGGRSKSPLARTYAQGNDIKVRLNNDHIPSILPCINFSRGQAGDITIQAIYDLNDKEKLKNDLVKTFVRNKLAQDPSTALVMVEEAMTKFVKVENYYEELRMTCTVNTDNFKLLYLKILYEICFLEIGAHYLEDDIAKEIRNSIKSRTISQTLRGEFPLSDSSFSNIFKDNTHHYIILYKKSVTISLFGLWGSFPFTNNNRIEFTEETAILYDFNPHSAKHVRVYLHQHLNSLTSPGS